MKTKIKIRSWSGNWDPTPVPADVKGIWAIHHPTMSGDTRRWTVTHVPTGARIATYDKRTEAVACREAALKVPGAEKITLTKLGAIKDDPENAMAALAEIVAPRRANPAKLAKPKKIAP